MSGGADNTERFEQIGQSWIKHTFGADEGDDCDLGCNTNNCTTFSQLCPGCSDPYLAEENGWYDLLGSRAWVNPFTGAFPSDPDPANHNGHAHDGVSHRVRVNVPDLNTTLNAGATYFAEAHTWTRLSTRGVRPILGSATCITTLPTISSLLTAQRASSHFPLLARP